MNYNYYTLLYYLLPTTTSYIALSLVILTTRKVELHRTSLNGQHVWWQQHPDKPLLQVTTSGCRVVVSSYRHVVESLSFSPWSISQPKVRFLRSNLCPSRLSVSNCRQIFGHTQRNRKPKERMRQKTLRVRRTDGAACLSGTRHPRAI